MIIRNVTIEREFWGREGAVKIVLRICRVENHPLQYIVSFHNSIYLHIIVRPSNPLDLYIGTSTGYNYTVRGGTIVAAEGEKLLNFDTSVCRENALFEAILQSRKLSLQISTCLELFDGLNRFSGVVVKYFSLWNTVFFRLGHNLSAFSS